MHCYCCDKLLNNPTLDGPTGRYYCLACLEPLIEEQFRLAGRDYIPIEVLDDLQEQEEAPAQGANQRWTDEYEPELEDYSDSF